MSPSIAHGPFAILLAMSEPRRCADLVRLTRESMEATNRCEFDEAMSVFADDAVFDVSSAGVGRFEGVGAVRTYLEDWIGAYEEQVFRSWEGSDLGGGVVFVLAHLDARPRGSPRAVQETWAFTVVWDEGRIVRVTADGDVGQARRRSLRLAEGRLGAARSGPEAPTGGG
jgi:ketosteroid isomerase-like protein